MSDPGLPGSGQAAGFQAQFGTFLQLLTKIALNMPSVPISAGQYPGTTHNDDAAAGNIGEYVPSVIAVGSPVSLVTATPKNITSIALTPGDWNVWAYIGFTGNAATTVTSLEGSLSLTTGTIDSTPGRRGDQYYGGATVFASLSPQFACGMERVSLNAGASVFLVASAAFATNTCSGFGGIFARRAR